MTRRAFTLVELLVVIAIVGLLVALVSPSFRSVRAMARSTTCKSNLHQVVLAFASTAPLVTGRADAPFPDPFLWPSATQQHVGDAGIYLCPELPTGFSATNEDASAYGIYTTQDCMLIPFADIPDHCIVNDHGDYEEYRFEAGRPDNRRDFDDVVFHVSKGRKRVATFSPDNPNQPYAGIESATLSLRYRGEVVPGWEDFRNCRPGTTFSFISLGGGGVTSYGINIDSPNVRFGSNHVVLLDYLHAIVNDGEDVPTTLGRAARHLGRLNVLYGDQSVKTVTPIVVDPILHPKLWIP